MTSRRKAAILSGVTFGAALGAVGIAARAIVRARRSKAAFDGNVVLITGGSRGLGLALAREFGSRGATVAIAARHGDQLERAKRDLIGRGIRCDSFLCDVADCDQINEMVSGVTKKLGQIDVLVNNAGIIRVGPAQAMQVRDFDQAMKVMFWGMLHSTLAVLPAMRSRREGRIVNITSIGGKVAVPHLLPYSCAKFAAVALSEGLCAELAKDGITVTTVVPGLMRTGSHLQAEFKGDHAKEYGWFAAGAATPLVSIGAGRAARSIVRAVIRRRREKVLSIPAEILARAEGMAPGLLNSVLAVTNRLMPSSEDSAEVRTGRDIESSFNAKLWKVLTWPGRKAAHSLNELSAN